VQLGGVAEGTLELVSARSKLPAYGLDLTNGRDHVDQLSRALATFGKSVRAAIKTAESAGDMGTSDLFIEISRELDEMLWMVEAHQHGDR
jgi:starvation-inducible DNA-binding protein